MKSLFIFNFLNLARSSSSAVIPSDNPQIKMNYIASSNSQFSYFDFGNVPIAMSFIL